MDVTADVKCYHCGHVSGQITGPKGGPLRITRFAPRPGFKGQLPGPGSRLRCERCKGPVFLEDVSPMGLDLVPANRRARLTEAA
jgi:hypothetical protein